MRRHNELLHDRCAEIAGYGVEEHRCVLAKLTVGGEQGVIGVNAGGDVVVIAGAEVEIALDAVGFPTDDERNLGVGFESGNTVNHVSAHS